MKDEIVANLSHPAHLEKLYRQDKQAFKKGFNSLYPEPAGDTLIGFWQQRLNYTSDEMTWGNKKEILFVIVAALLAGFTAKVPALLQIDEAFFYTRNIGFIVFPALVAYFAFTNKIAVAKIASLAAVMLAALFFINWLPRNPKSDTLVLSCIHVVLFLWAVLYYAFISRGAHNKDYRLLYLRYNGDLLVMSALIVIAGGIMTGVTLGLFSIIGLDISQFYFENVALFGLAAVPVVATYLIQTNPQLVGRVSPVIAKIFSPLVLLMLVIYLAAIVFSGKDPYNDREFLLIFNALLIGVLAIIFFSFAETSKTGHTRFEVWVLLLLSAVTIVVNGIALSAILFRISEWGLTPNRAAVLGSNVLILMNLCFVTVQLYKWLVKKASPEGVGNAITNFLPVYFVWVMLVAFLFPFLFSFA